MSRHVEISIYILKKPSMSAPTNAGSLINSSKEVLAYDGGSSENKCMHRCGDDQIAEQINEIFKSHEDKRTTAPQTEKNAALAQVEELLLKTSREASKHKTIEVLEFLRQLILHPADYGNSLSSLGMCLNISRRDWLKKLTVLHM